MTPTSKPPIPADEPPPAGKPPLQAANRPAWAVEPAAGALRAVGGIPLPGPVYGSLGLATAIVLAPVTLVRLGAGPGGWIALAFTTTLIALAAIDAEHRLIPNRIVVPAAALVLTAQICFFPERAAEWLAAGVGAAGALLVPAVLRRGSMGAGDVKLAFLLGVGLGRDVLTALVLGSIAALPVALFIIARQGLGGRKAMIPLGPFLAIGGVLALLLGNSP